MQQTVRKKLLATLEITRYGLICTEYGLIQREYKWYKSQFGLTEGDRLQSTSGGYGRQLPLFSGSPGIYAIPRNNYPLWRYQTTQFLVLKMI